MKTRILPNISLALATCVGMAGYANAIDIRTSNPDLKIRADNTIRYNAGWRVSDRDSKLANNPANDEAEYLFDKGDMVTNRIDLFSEFDLSWQKRLGARVSASAWYDERFPSKGKNHPDLEGMESNPENRWSSYTERYYSGLSGEFVDAFVWGNFEFRDMYITARAGRHALLWGEAVFPTASGNSVAFAQAPGDSWKQVTSPGATAKETVLPLNQLTAEVQLTPSLTLAGLYTFEWRSTRVPEGGTFFGAADPILMGPDRVAPGLPRYDAKEGKSGDWGLNLRWHSAFNRGSDVGFYYREFDDKGPSWAVQMIDVPGSALHARAVYAQDIKVMGASIATTVKGHAVSAEVSRRENGPLVSVSPIFTSGSDFEGARGDTWHFLINSTSSFGKSSWYDSAAWVNELTYQRLDKVTQNKGHYKSKSSMPGACVSEIAQACATRDAWHFATSFNTTWNQVVPGFDLSLPFILQTGLKGNAPTGGINEGGTVFKIGLDLDYQRKHLFQVGYTNYMGKTKNVGQSSAAGSYHAANGPQATYKNRDVVNFTYSTTF